VPEEVPAVRPPAHRPPRFTRKDLFWLVLLVLVAFGLRAWRIDYPDREYFDEIYYVDAAQKLMEGKEDPNNVHPPLAKLQLGLGIRFVDALRARGVPLNKTVGWRVGSLFLGTLIIPLTFYLGWILPGGGRFTAFVAAGLVSFDFMHLVQSRIAMLDMYQAFWIMLGLIAAWKYLEAGPRCWLWASAAAVCLGAATACKWSGLFAAVGAYLAMALLWPGGFRFGRSVALGLLFAMLITAVYVQSYTPLFVREHAMGYKQLKTIVGYHQRMWRFRYDEKQFNHRYLSEWYSWPVVWKPVWYVYEEPRPPSTGSSRSATRSSGGPSSCSWPRPPCWR
jgi:dolichyl-phosphate-mannose--protein O-mannosyl transferase